MSYVVGTAGHIDHGKSTLIHALTGIDPDRLEEEKRRGMTIDLGFAYLTLPSGRLVGSTGCLQQDDLINTAPTFAVRACSGVSPEQRWYHA